MNESEKLINMIQDAVGGCARRWAEIIAEYLLKNGVIVSPCELGNKLYCVFSPKHPANPAHKGKWFMKEYEVARFHYGVKGLSIEIYGYGTVNESELGKTVFLSREEAEQELRKRELK